MLIKSILPFCFLLTFAGAAAAQTEDDSPPSEETVCDGQTGAAYGLCTAFCEAMDCDSDEPQASQTACDKVAGKFLQITGEAPPCLAPPLPPCGDCLEGFHAPGCEVPACTNLVCAVSPGCCAVGWIEAFFGCVTHASSLCVGAVCTQ